MDVTTQPTIAFEYFVPSRRVSLWAAELAQLLCVFIGIGATPGLRLRFDWFWVIGLLLGLTAMVIGIVIAVHLIRTRAAAQPDSGPPRPSLRTRFAAGWRRLRHGRSSPVQPRPPRVVLPLATILIGLFTVLPAAVAAIVQRIPIIDDEHLVAMFFSGPAILLWIAAEGFYFYPRLVSKPKRTAELTGMARSITKTISALLLWVFLGLSFGMDGIGWMFVVSIGLAVISLILGTIADRQAARLEQQQDALERAQQQVQTAPSSSIATS